MSSRIVNCIAYTRVSTEKQVRSGASEKDLENGDFAGHSIREQTEAIKKFCSYKSNEEVQYQLIKVFNDPGVSAKKIPFFERPSGKEIKEFLQEAGQEVKYLIIKSLDRAFRDTEDGLYTARLLNENFGVDLYVVEGNGDPVSTSSALGKFIFTQLLSVDDFQVSKNNERTSDVLRSKQRNGKKLGRTPLGCRRNDDNTGFIPDFASLRLIARVYRYKVVDGMRTSHVEKKTGLCKDRIRTCVQRYEELKNIPVSERFYRAKQRRASQ